MDRNGSGGQGWGSWLASKVNPWSGEQQARAERNQQRDTNERVVNTKATLADMKKKRRFLSIKAEKIKKQAMAPNTSQQEAVRLANEYKHVDGEIRQLDAILRNVQGAASALDTTATNVKGFEAMRDAQEGLEAVTQQVQPHQIDRVMSRLQTNVDNGREIGRAMSQDLDWGLDTHDSHYMSASDQASNDLLSEWRNEVQVNDLPDAPVRTIHNDNNNGGGQTNAVEETRQQENKI